MDEDVKSVLHNIQNNSLYILKWRVLLTDTELVQETTRSSGKKSQTPVQLDLGGMLAVLEQKQQTKTKQSSKPVVFSGIGCDEISFLLTWVVFKYSNTKCNLISYWYWSLSMQAGSQFKRYKRKWKFFLKKKFQKHGNQNRLEEQTILLGKKTVQDSDLKKNTLQRWLKFSFDKHVVKVFAFS